MKKYTMPTGLNKKSVGCASTNKEAITMAIKLLRQADAPVYDDTLAYDPQFPYIYWDGNEVTQTSAAPSDRDYDIDTNTVEEFVAIILGEKPVFKAVEVKLNGNYNAVIKTQTQTYVEVGCQSVPFSAIEELYKKIQELKGA